jgi:SsrA-binding protein
MSKKKVTPGTIALNKKARHEYFIADTYEAGLALEGWEVKSLRAGKGNISDAYVMAKNGEAFLLNAHISPLLSASTHVNPDPLRSRKLLLHHRELGQIFGALATKGMTCVPLALYWKNGRVKCEIALATGKKLHDKRATEKERDWGREKQRLLRTR